MNQPQIYTCPLLPPPTPSHPSRLLQSTCFSSLSHTSNSHWLSILYMMECMFLNGKSNDEEPFCREWVAKKSALCTHFVLPGNWKLRMWRFSDFWHVCVCVCVSVYLKMCCKLLLSSFTSCWKMGLWEHGYKITCFFDGKKALRPARTLWERSEFTVCWGSSLRTIRCRDQCFLWL